MRSLALVAIALSIATVLLHVQIAAALVTRGDELSYARDDASALVMYRRALSFDPDDATAVDRLVFTAVLSHQKVTIANAIVAANAFLARHTSASVVLFDRGLAYERVGDWLAARDDFSRAGSLARDARALTFAGLLDLRLRRRADARRDLRLACRFDAHFVPATRALARLGVADAR